MWQQKKETDEAGKQTGYVTNTHSLLFNGRRVSQHFFANFLGIAAKYWLWYKQDSSADP